MKKYISISKTVLLAVVVIALGSCNDTWNDHYSFKETDSKYPVAKLAETLGGISGFDKFCTVLSTTRMCDKNGTPLNMTYMDLLNEDQFLTVWAPSNASVSDELWAQYTKRDKTAAEHKQVGEQFVENHIARFKHSVGEGTDGRIIMLNGKGYSSKADAISGQSYHGDDMNIRCSNGVLHCIDGHLDFLPSLYEYLTTAPEYQDLIGNWFKSFTVEELDPSRSVAQGINDNGEMVYIDSVMVTSNRLIRYFGHIDSEDSLYAIVLPTPELWNQEYDRIKKSFVYGEKFLNNDSLQQFYTRFTMMTDMFFNVNPKVQRYMPDSIFSTLYAATENRREGKSYHMFKDPYDKTSGIFGSCVDSVVCSNGTIYFIDKWPFDDKLTYLRQLKLEAETYTSLSDFTLKQYAVQVIGGEVLDNPIQVMRVYSDKRFDWDASYYVNNHLKGRYAIKLVIAPNSVDSMPNYIHPRITFTTPTKVDSVLLDSNTVQKVEYRPGKYRTQTLPMYLVNDLQKLDTLLVGEVDLPYCNYDMNQARLCITLRSGVNGSNSVKYSSEMWLDCIILDPVVEPDPIVE